ncbi:Yip1 family protein [Streptomyces sp. NPDC002888]|uniref:Yip1 family protein n=1 Tax=Streptomyces sp. NPDC002888 TaxID=3364668 RepID=UPI0036AF95ED
MSIRPWVVVEPPDSRGLRRVVVGGETVGRAWSLGELRKILGRHGYPEDLDLQDPASVCWRGGDSRAWPDRAWRRRGVTVLVVAGLLASMALNAVVGGPDASGALTFAQRISGVSFLLAGAVQLLAAGAAVDYGSKRQSKVSGAVVLLGVLIALATDSLLLLMWFEEMEFTTYALVFMPLWCWSVWALFFLVRDKSWKGVPQPKRFAAGVVATALLTGISLAYSTMYQPTAAPMHFALKAEFGKAQVDRTVSSYVQVPLTLYVKNTGGIPVYIVNDMYKVRARGAGYEKYSDEGDLEDEWRKSAGKRGEEAELHVGQIGYTMLSSGHFYGPGNRIESGQEYTLRHVFQLPKDATYDTVKVDLRIFYMRKDRGKLDVEEFETPHYSWKKRSGRYYCPLSSGCAPTVIYHGLVRHNNNLVNLTRAPRYVTAIWSPLRDPIASISPFHFQGESNFRQEEKRELDRYGAAQVSLTSEVSLAELLRSS